MSDYSRFRSAEPKNAANTAVPRLYAVILHNDNYTTMDFVVLVLMKVFHRNAADAASIMMSVHEKGEGLAGIFPYDIAVTKKILSEKMAEENGFPLKLTVTPAQEASS